MLAKIENRGILGVICTLVMLVSLLSAAAQAEPFKRTASGWLNRTEVDVNGNGSPLSLLTTFGH